MADDATTLRRCIGSARYGIEAHDATVADFPVQPSQKDGLGRMCKPHWKEYASALRKAALARKAAEPETAPMAESEPVADAGASAPRRSRSAKAEPAPDVAEATAGE